MIKVTVMYPAGEGKTFDLNYYLERHGPLVKDLLGEALLSMEVLHGVSGLFPGSEPVYLVICNLTFQSVDSFSGAMMPVASRIMGDIPNFTNSSPIVQISNLIP